MSRLLSAVVKAIPFRARRWVAHIPGVAAAQRWLINRTLSGRPFIHTIDTGPAGGLHCEITLPQDKAFWLGTFELEFARALKAAVRPGDVCYDIGAHHGYMSGVLALAGAKSVEIFEPLPANGDFLERLATLNPTLPLHLHRLAVGAMDETSRFEVMDDQSMGKLESSTFQSNKSSIRPILVNVVRIDTCVFSREFPPPNLIKVDVEGAETQVLKGAIRCLETLRPRLFLEVHSEQLEKECTRLLQHSAYVSRRLQPRRFASDQVRHLTAEPA